MQAHRPEIDAAFETPPSWRPGDGGSHVVKAMCPADVDDRVFGDPDAGAQLIALLDGFNAGVKAGQPG